MTHGEAAVSRGSKTLLVKFVVIGLVSVVILMSLAWVGWVISDREAYRQAAVTSISESYASGQRLVGPVLVQPYTQVQTADGTKGVTPKEVEGRYFVFPTDMEVDGTISPSERYHGIYKVPVYELQTRVQSTFDLPQSPIAGTVRYGQPYLVLGVSDVRGLVGRPRLRVNGSETMLTQDSGSAKLGLKAMLRGLEGGQPGSLRVELAMTLAGTQHLAIAPVANSNHVELVSTWRSPLFAGRFLPRSREVSNRGFRAAWDVSSLASATQQQIGDNLSGDMDTMDVNLLEPIDPYKLSMRAVKYGVLFVLLTFAGFFGFEVIQRAPIHPVQYLLVGFGLAMFFLLLVSFSEHIRFGWAYLIASVATIGLLGFYLSYVLHSSLRGAGFSTMLTVLYAAVYGLLISEENALLMGSLLLFAMLAAVMYVTRKVDWYRGSAELVEARVADADGRLEVKAEKVPPPPIRGAE